MQRTERISERVTTYLIVLGVVFVGILVFTVTRNTVAEPAPSSVPTVSKYDEGPPDASEIFELVNAERAAVKIAPLKIDERLNKSAQIKANDMLTRGYYSHEDPQGKSGASYVFEQAPDVCMFAAENLIKGDTLFTSRQSIDSWKSSPAHYSAMIDGKYTLTGFGIAGNIVVQHFCLEY